MADDQKVFVSDTDGPEEYNGFFEDDGDTGYLYVSDRREKKIVQHLQIYVNSPDLSVNESDVEVVWSTDGTRCGVRIWGALRGVIDVRFGTQARAFVTSRDSDPIHAAEWSAGFDELSQTEGAEAESGRSSGGEFFARRQGASDPAVDRGAVSACPLRRRADLALAS